MNLGCRSRDAFRVHPLCVFVVVVSAPDVNEARSARLRGVSPALCLREYAHEWMRRFACKASDACDICLFGFLVASFLSGSGRTEIGPPPPVRDEYLVGGQISKAVAGKKGTLA